MFVVSGASPTTSSPDQHATFGFNSRAAANCLLSAASIRAVVQLSAAYCCVRISLYRIPIEDLVSRCDQEALAHYNAWREKLDLPLRFERAFTMHQPALYSVPKHIRDGIGGHLI